MPATVHGRISQNDNFSTLQCRLDFFCLEVYFQRLIHVGTSGRIREVEGTESYADGETPRLARLVFVITPRLQIALNYPSGFLHVCANSELYSSYYSLGRLRSIT